MEKAELHMNRLIVVALLGLMFAASSYGAALKNESVAHVAFTFGLTAGGSSIATAKYTNGDSTSIHGGGLVQLGVGAYFHKSSVPASALLTINYHVDSTSARNGNIRFDRWPLELVGYYHINDSWRIGAGLRHVMNPKLRVDMDDEPSTTVDYQDTNSPIFEVAWGQVWARNNFWVSLRYVHESLKAQRVGYDYISTTDVNHTDDGSHFGLLLHYAL